MRYLLLFVAVVLFPLLSVAQEWEWVKATGGDKVAGAIRMNQGTAICTDEDGNVYAAGYFAGRGVFGRDTLNTYGNTDPLLIKYDSSGKLQWARKITEGRSDYCYAVCVDRAQNVCVTGSASGQMISIFTAKYDRDGNLQWIKESHGEDCIAYSRAIVTDRVGNIYVAGDCSGEITLDTFAIGQPSKYTIFLIKYDLKGRMLWVKHSAPADKYFNQARGMTIDPMGNIFMTGVFTDKLLFNKGEVKSNGDQDMFVARLSGDGSPQWLKSWGSKEADMPRSIVADTRGNFYLTAFFTGDCKVKGRTMRGENLIKCSTSGEILWHMQIGVAEHDYETGSFVTVDKDDKPILSGNTYGVIPIFGDKQVYCNGASDLFVAGCSADGTLLWKTQAGGSGVDEGSAICVDNANNIYVTGYFHDRVDFGKITIHSRSGDDGMWVGKLKAGR